MADADHKPKAPWEGYKLVVIALLLTAGGWLLAMLSAFASNLAHPLLASAAMVAAVVAAAVLGFAGLACLIVGSVRWALLDFKHIQQAQQQRQQIAQLLQSLNERSLLSDTAKRLAYREQDRKALSQVIESDIAKGDFDAAMVLLDEMAQTYGYRQEAEDYRDRIMAARAAFIDRKIDEALEQLNAILKQHDWDKAAREATKIQRLYPDSPRTRDLLQHVRDAREQRKKDLEREFLRAAERDELDRAIELLKELDRYLTEREAAPFLETARGVIGKKRQNLGVQFKLAVHDRDWVRAIQVGEQLIREFPNTKMTEEVRGMMDVLRERAASQRAADGLQQQSV